MIRRACGRATPSKTLGTSLYRLLPSIVAGPLRVCNTGYGWERRLDVGAG